MIESEEQKDIDDMLKKLPDKFAALIKGYKWKFQKGNVLDNDGKHIGVIDDDKKTITVAAPWNYGREFTALHEIGHMVWEKYVPEKLRKEWREILKNTDKKLPQGAEELFCMAFANFYADAKIVIHTHATWQRFIKKVSAQDIQ